jgi:hypothetical protein
MPSASLATSLTFALATSGIALGAGQEDRRTPRAKAVLVSQLDATLPKISLVPRLESHVNASAGRLSE